MREKNNVIAEPKPIGVIDVITAGFEVVRKHPWAMLPPILVDTGIWLLPRLGLADLIRGAYEAWLKLPDLPPDQVAALREQRDLFNQVAGSVNLFTPISELGNWLARLPSLFTPSLVNGTTIDVRSPINALAYTLQLPSAGYALVLFIGFLLLVLLAGAVYVELVAQGVRPLQSETPLAAAWRATMLWLRLIGFALLLAMIFVGASLILGLILLVLPATADTTSFFLSLGLVGWFWLSIYFFFAVSAMAVNNIGLMPAIRRSVLVFRVNFWPSILLIGLSVFLGEGLSLLWRGLTVTPVGILLGIIANAFIGTGLLAASMIFYQDRMNAIERMIAHARAASRSTR